jgi:hypothetical protein
MYKCISKIFDNKTQDATIMNIPHFENLQNIPIDVECIHAMHLYCR